MSTLTALGLRTLQTLVVAAILLQPLYLLLVPRMVAGYTSPRQ